MTDNMKLIHNMRNLVDNARRQASGNLSDFFDYRSSGSIVTRGESLGTMLQGIGALADATLKLTIAEKVQNEMDGLE